jgi:hypothetical protein
MATFYSKILKDCLSKTTFWSACCVAHTQRKPLSRDFVHRGTNSQISNKLVCVDGITSGHLSTSCVVATPVPVTLFKSYRLRGLLSGRPETDSKGSCRLTRGAVTGLSWSCNTSHSAPNDHALPQCNTSLQMTTHCHIYIFNPPSNNITSLLFASALNY